MVNLQDILAQALLKHELCFQHAYPIFDMIFVHEMLLLSISPPCIQNEIPSTARSQSHNKQQNNSTHLVGLQLSYFYAVGEVQSGEVSVTFPLKELPMRFTQCIYIFAQS